MGLRNIVYILWLQRYRAYGAVQIDILTYFAVNAAGTEFKFALPVTIILGCVFPG